MRKATYRQNANRLRNELHNRNSSRVESNESATNTESRPPGLRGRDIGLWYAQRNQRRVAEGGVGKAITQLRMLTGPSVSLSDKKNKQLQETIRNIRKSIKDPGSEQNNQSSLSRHNRLDFMDLLKSSAKSFHCNESVDLDKRLHDDFVSSTLSEKYTKMLQFRQNLPSFSHKDEIVDSIKKNKVILIAGNTGCGKTTQVAQYILDDAIMNTEGSKTKILCTQPRRIAATSIAERVAFERGEELGISTGYQIRLEKVMPRSDGSILYCTTGVLLKFMEIHPTIKGYSHIIIDEIHERNATTDICLTLIKHIIQHRTDLKIILMSATLNAEKFSEFFFNCPILHIEGFTYFVQELFLEDVLEETGYNSFKSEKKNEPIWCQYKYKNQRTNEAQQFELTVGKYANSLQGKYSKTTIDNLLKPETEKIDVNFIQHLNHHISNQKAAGAILVILPGFTVISKLYENLQKSPQFSPSKFIIHPLHSLLTGNDQRNIFNRPPEGIRKIILSTPLAETSITIDDVVYVINAGKMRRPYFDFERGATVFEDQWITKANETQRKGRAGRVQEGICYHLYTRARSNFFEPFEEPEIRRIRLEENILTLKLLCINDLRSFVSTMIDVPERFVIDSSINLLQRLGALTDGEQLTPLGLHLARLGVAPKIGKMLLLGSIFSCFDPISSISAGLSFKSPFYTVMGKEQLCDNAKRTFSTDSDQLAVANAVMEWKKSNSNQRDFCYKYFISHSTMTMLDRMKTQFSQSLYHTQFLSNPQCDNEANNRHSKNVNLLRGLMCGGLYPNVAYRFVKINKGRRIDTIKATDRKRLKLLPGSVNSDPSRSYDPGFLVFHELNKFTNNYFVTETTSNVSPYAILMFGDKVELSFRNNINYISVGGIVEFQCNLETANIIIDLRKEFNRLLENKITESSPIVWNSSEGQLLTTILDLISMVNEYEVDECGDDDEDVEDLDDN